MGQYGSALDNLWAVVGGLAVSTYAEPRTTRSRTLGAHRSRHPVAMRRTRSKRGNHWL